MHAGDGHFGEISFEHERKKGYAELSGEITENHAPASRIFARAA
jgi:hypothetical protein